MKVLTRQLRTAGGLLLLASVVAPTALRAQRRFQQNERGPDPDTPRFMVSTLRSPEKGLGVKAAEEIRSRMTDDNDVKKFYIIPSKMINTLLEASGFSPDTAPSLITSKLLAAQLRADQFLDGQVTHTPNGYRIESRVVLTRDVKETQPLPPAEGKSLGDVAKAVSHSVNEARKQLPAVNNCFHALQNNKPDSAAHWARQAIAAYPNSSLGNACLANAYANAKMPPDSVIRAAQAALTIDPRNIPALQTIAQAYKDAKHDSLATNALTRLLALDPGNVKLQQQVVNDLALSGNAKLAVPIIDTAVAQNPGEPELMRLQWLVLLAAKDWKRAIQSGEGLMKSDTAVVDSTFFTRLAQAYANDSQPQKAAETTARGVAKYPNSATLWSLHSQTLRAAGQTQQSIDAAKKALQLDPKIEHGQVRLAQAMIEAGQSDSAWAYLRQASAGPDKELAGQIMLVEANKAYKAAAASKKREDWEKAVSVLTAADSVGGTAPGKFLLGVSAFQLADAAVRENQSAKSCDLAKTAQSALATAQINLQQGGSVQPETAKQLLTAMPQYTAPVESQVKKFCK